MAKAAMPGFSEAVQILPPREPVTTGGISALKPTRETARRRSASTMSKVAWIPQSDLDQAEWLATGRRLGTIGRCGQWWIGDWIRYGASRWGEKYAEAARVTGYDVASLRNMAWVASQFDLSLRSDKLTWSHHVLLAPLEAEEQRHWLDRAHEERLSVADLRIELRATRGGAEKAASSDPAAGSGEQVGAGVCPHCGHQLPKPTD
jgi:hypothetical protein